MSMIVVDNCPLFPLAVSPVHLSKVLYLPCLSDVHNLALQIQEFYQLKNCTIKTTTHFQMQTLSLKHQLANTLQCIIEDLPGSDLLTGLFDSLISYETVAAGLSMFDYDHGFAKNP